MTAFKILRRRLLDSVIAMLLKDPEVMSFSLFTISSMWTISFLEQSCLDTEELFTKTI